MTSYQQPPPAAPSGPSTSSTSTRNSKLDQIIQVNLYNKNYEFSCLIKSFHLEFLYKNCTNCYSGTMHS